VLYPNRKFLVLDGIEKSPELSVEDTYTANRIRDVTRIAGIDFG